MHVVLDVAPTVVEKKPAAHGTHALLDSAPTVSEYNPAAHGRHVSPPVAPTAVEYKPAAHGTHVALDVAPTVVERSDIKPLYTVDEHGETKGETCFWAFKKVSNNKNKGARLEELVDGVDTSFRRRAWRAPRTRARPPPKPTRVDSAPPTSSFWREMRTRGSRETRAGTFPRGRARACMTRRCLIDTWRRSAPSARH